MKIATTALLLSLSALSAGAYAASNFEPNNVPFQGVYTMTHEGPSRAQIKAELTAAKMEGKVSNVEPNALPSFPPTPARPMANTASQ